MTQQSVERLLEELNKKYSPDGAVVPVLAKANARPTQEFATVTSPAFGFVLGTGGIALGHLHEFFGKEHAGKTTLMMITLKNIYEHFNGERPLAFIDIEHRFNENWARMLGLPEDLIVVQPTDAEQATDIMQTLIKPTKGGTGVCAIGFDSIGAASSLTEHLSFEDRSRVIGGSAGVMTRNVKTIAPIANLFGTTVLYANQLRADMAGYNRPTTPGGYAVKHMMSTRVYLWPNTQRDSKKFDKIDGAEVQVGFEMNFKIVKNTFGPAYREGKSIFYFRPSRLFNNVGFDIEADIQALGMLTEVIARKGSYYEYAGVKAQGRDPFFSEIKSQGLYDQLLADVQRHLDGRFSMFAEEEDRGAAYVPLDDAEI